MWGKIIKILILGIKKKNLKECIVLFLLSGLCKIIKKFEECFIADE